MITQDRLKFLIESISETVHAIVFFNYQYSFGRQHKMEVMLIN